MVNTVPNQVLSQKRTNNINVIGPLYMSTSVRGVGGARVLTQTKAM
jgi:hypothetical protein